jgi:Putative auto-transporter adhesin, head GIN domain
MRNLLLFMLLVGLFVFGTRTNGFYFGGIRGEGPTIAQTRDLPTFHTVESDISADIVLHMAPETRAVFSIEANLAPLLQTVVEDGRLRIYFTKPVNYQHNLVIDLYAPAYDGLSMQGSGNVTAADSLKAQAFRVDLTGSGNIKLDRLVCDQLDASITGSGGIELGGMARQMDVNIGGSGECQLRGLSAQTGKVQITGSGNVYCTVQESLDALITGSGDVEYTGAATTIKSSVTGSGDIRRAN